jgi:regulator of sigma E protease
MGILNTGFAFIVVLGIIIFVHEFGHFVTAKAFGMRVFIFSFGFGTRLLGFKWGDTDYRISLIPLGGYVKLEGEPDDQLSEDVSKLGDGKDFTVRPRWQRFLVYLAGPVMNGVLTIAVFTGIFVYGSGEVDATPFDRPVMGHVEPGSPAEAAGLKPADEIVSIDGQPTPDWETAVLAIAIRPDTQITLGIRRQGQTLTLPIRSTSDQKDKVGRIGVSPMVRVGKLTPDMPAEQAGLRRDDGVLRIDDKPIRSFGDVLEIIQGSNGRPLRFWIYREPEFLEIQVTPRLTPEGHRVGLGPKGIVKTFGPAGAFMEACRTTWRQTKLTFDVLQRLLTGRLSAKTMMGPLGIAKKSGEAAEEGWDSYFLLIAMISLQVGILNLFPLAPLDGGHLAILAGEGVMRRDLSMAAKAWIMNAGAIVLLGLIVVVLYSDLSKTSLLGKYLP